MDFLYCDLAGKVHAEGILNCRRCYRLYISVHIMFGLASGMIHLAEDLCVIFVDCFRELFVAFDLLVVVKTGNELVALRVHIYRIVFCDDHAPAALGFLFDILDIPLCDHSVFRAQVHDHCRYDQPVRDLAASDFCRCKKFRHHFLVPPVCLERWFSYVKILTDGTIPRSMPKKRRDIRSIC